MRYSSFIALALPALALILLCVTSCQAPGAGKTTTPPSDSTYTLTGNVEGLDSDWVYLVHRQSDTTRVDSARAVNGQFVFAGRATTPEYCLLAFTHDGQIRYRTEFFLQHGELGYSGKRDSLFNARFTGSPESAAAC